MVTRLFSRTPLHEHPEAAQRILGVEQLPPDSAELAALVAADPAPEVRAAAAARCADLSALANAWEKEADAGVRDALAAALGRVLSGTPDGAAARAFLESSACNDAIRADVARHAKDADRRLAAIASLRDEALLVELAISGGTRGNAARGRRMRALPGGAARPGRRRPQQGPRGGAPRQAAAGGAAGPRGAGERSRRDPRPARGPGRHARPHPHGRGGPQSPLAGAGHARGRRPPRALRRRAPRAAGALRPRAGRAGGAREVRAPRERLDRRRWPHPTARTRSPACAPSSPPFATRRPPSATKPARERLAQAGTRIEGWEQELKALAGAEALVVEAERLAADTSVDNAQLPERWQALDRAIRTPALTRRFEAALVVVEQRRLAQAQVAREETHAARNRVHALLLAAEQALAAGQLHAARAAVDEMKTIKGEAGALPKPTQQRMGRVGQQLGELERWESFGQQSARLQLCERAEAILAQGLDASRTAAEVKKLREEWKALDAQHAGVPRSLWERFDGACEKAYAPAARHFAELAAQRKLARKQREDFIAAAAAHAPTLLGESPDPRAIERWLRETDRAWREGELGSVDPSAWKKLDARLKEARRPAARRAGRGARAGEERPPRAHRRGRGADAARHGSRGALAGEGHPGALAGARQGPPARAARRARAVGAVPRRLRRRVRGPPRQAQGGGRPQGRGPPLPRGDLHPARAAREGERQGREGRARAVSRPAGPLARRRPRRRPGAARRSRGGSAAR